MKKIILILTAVMFIFAITGCSSGGGGSRGGNSSTNGSSTNRKFWAVNFVTENYYQVTANLLAQGVHCNVWVEEGCGVDESTARKVANAYDSQIYQKMINAFNLENAISFNGRSFSNTMALADYFGDGDGKLLILLLDIKDGYQGVNSAYVAGYFNPPDLVSVTGMRSNNCDMIYIDVNPGEPGTDKSNTTLAHEMQHMMNLVSTIAIRSTIQGNVITAANEMDLWINEGLSSAAEWVYSQKIDTGHIAHINQGRGRIRQGNNFFVWGNRDAEDNLAIIDEYATVYLFFQWLRLQAGSSNIYRKIISSSKNNWEAVSSVINTAVPGQNYSNWGTLLEAWLADNYSGVNGYKNDSALKDIAWPLLPNGNATLYPGEGIFSTTSNFSNTNIKTRNMGGETLTYNADTNNKNTGVSGTVTSINVNASIVAGSASGPAGGQSGPYPISAGDMLRRNGLGGDFQINESPLFLFGTAEDE